MWYLVPNESHSSDGRFTGYLDVTTKLGTSLTPATARSTTLCTRLSWEVGSVPSERSRPVESSQEELGSTHPS
jgi:hypothetical protein